MVSCLKPAVCVLLLFGIQSYLQAGEGPQVVDESYTDQVLKWRSEHETRFRSPTGWLALIGHYWLQPGENSLGTSEDCEVRLPADASKEVVGFFRLSGNRVSLTITAGGPMLVDGQASVQADLPIDSGVPESDCAVKLEVGDRLKLQLVRRAGKFAVRVRDSASESIQEFKGKQWFDVDPDYRVVAKYTPFAQPKSVKIVNVKGDEIESMIAGTLEFQLKGQTLQLEAIAESPESLFVIFKDRTNGQSTYGAGRFVDVELAPNKDGNVVIDFNKTYSPPCAWSPHTLCPLPPKQNHLPLAIPAGEKRAR